MVVIPRDGQIYRPANKVEHRWIADTGQMKSAANLTDVMDFDGCHQCNGTNYPSEAMAIDMYAADVLIAKFEGVFNLDIDLPYRRYEDESSYRRYEEAESYVCYTHSVAFSFPTKQNRKTVTYHGLTDGHLIEISRRIGEDWPKILELSEYLGLHHHEMKRMEERNAYNILYIWLQTQDDRVTASENLAAVLRRVGLNLFVTDNLVSSDSADDLRSNKGPTTFDDSHNREPPAVNQGATSMAFKERTQELTDDRLLRLAEEITRADDLINLGVRCLKMKQKTVDRCITNNPGDITTAARKVLDKWRHSQTNSSIAYANLCQALRAAKLDFYINQALE